MGNIPTQSLMTESSQMKERVGNEPNKFICATLINKNNGVSRNENKKSMHRMLKYH